MEVGLEKEERVEDMASTMRRRSYTPPTAGPPHSNT